jgi:hypothetical protein
MMRGVEIFSKMEMQSMLPIAALIVKRIAELGLTREHVVRRCGYRNISKGLRHLDQLCQGDFVGAAGLVQALPTALELPNDVMSQAIEATKGRLQDAAEASGKAEFKPHAIIVTERTRPEPMFVAGIIGIDRLLRIEMDLMKSPVTFPSQAITGIDEKLRRWKSDRLPGFGSPLGFIVNYAVDRAVRFDLTGKPEAVLDRAYSPGGVMLLLRGKPCQTLTAV